MRKNEISGKGQRTVIVQDWAGENREVQVEVRGNIKVEVGGNREADFEVRGGNRKVKDKVRGNGEDREEVIGHKEVQDKAGRHSEDVGE